MTETDEQFLDSMEQWVIGSLVFKREHRERLFALARRGAAVENLGQVGQLSEEITRLRVENIQMQAALGYAICAEDERHIIPSNPYKCGVCDANKGIHDEIERLRAALGWIMGTALTEPEAMVEKARAALGEKP